MSAANWRKPEVLLSIPVMVRTVFETGLRLSKFSFRGGLTWTCTKFSHFKRVDSSSLSYQTKKNGGERTSRLPNRFQFASLSKRARNFPGSLSVCPNCSRDSVSVSGVHHLTNASLRREPVATPHQPAITGKHYPHAVWLADTARSISDESCLGCFSVANFLTFRRDGPFEQNGAR